MQEYLLSFLKSQSSHQRLDLIRLSNHQGQGHQEYLQEYFQVALSVLLTNQYLIFSRYIDSRLNKISTVVLKLEYIKEILI